MQQKQQTVWDWLNSKTAGRQADSSSKQGGISPVCTGRGVLAWPGAGMVLDERHAPLHPAYIPRAHPRARARSGRQAASIIKQWPTHPANIQSVTQSVSASLLAPSPAL